MKSIDVKKVMAQSKLSKDQVNGVLSSIQATELAYMRNAKLRNDFVMICIRQKAQLHGVAVSDRSIEGKEFIVIRVGPDVKELERGDMVFAVGTQGLDFVPLPGVLRLIMTKQANVPIIVGKCPEAEMPDAMGAGIPTS